MGSGSFARGRDMVSAYASMVFAGNIDNVKGLLKTSHLFAPFPVAMVDTAWRIAGDHAARPESKTVGPLVCPSRPPFVRKVDSR